MNQTEIVGVVVVGLGVIVGLLVSINNLITRPINELNVTIARLNSSIDSQKADHERLSRRVDKHGDRLDDHDKILARNNLK